LDVSIVGIGAACGTVGFSLLTGGTVLEESTPVVTGADAGSEMGFPGIGFLVITWIGVVP
jgi:hypothetical protein